MLAVVLSLIMHAQIGGGVPAIGSTQGSAAVSTATAYSPWVLRVGTPVVMAPGIPVVLFK